MNSGQTQYFDAYDNETSLPNQNIPQILNGNLGQRSYFQVQKSFINKFIESKEDAAAKIIQSAWRRYYIVKRFQQINHVFRELRLKRTKPVFNILLLNSQVSSINRKKIFLSIEQDAENSRVNSIGYKKCSYEGYKYTGLFMIPNTINEQKLIKFVKIMFRSKLIQIFREWRIRVCKQRTYKRLNRHDEKVRYKFGVPAKCFIMWYKYSRFKRNEKTSLNIPEWENFIRIELFQKAQKKKASKQFLRYLKKRALESLKNRTASKHIQNDALSNADAYRNIHVMQQANRAWIKFISDQKSRSSQMRIVFRSWLSHVLFAKRANILLKEFNARHRFFLLRRCLSFMIKNRKISKVLNFGTTNRVLNNPASALWFAYSIQNRSENAALCLAFKGWKKKVIGRKLFARFVFQDVKVGEYDFLKRRGLMALRKQKLSAADPMNFHSKNLREQTLEVYDNVINQKDDRSQFFLLMDKPSQELVQELATSVSTRKHQDLFLQAWCSTKTSHTLFTRVVMLVAAKRKVVNSTVGESVLTQYISAMNVLSDYGLMSAPRFHEVEKLIEQNNRIAVHNRRLLDSRDTIINLTHESHTNAIGINQEIPAFSILDQPKLDSIESANELINKEFLQPIPLSSLDSAINMQEFAIVDGCKAELPSFRDTIIKYRKMMRVDRRRVDLRGDTIFSQIHNDNTKRKMIVGRTDIATDLYNVKQKRATVRPRTGISDRMSNLFPLLKVREGKEIHVDTTQNDEEEETIDLQSTNNNSRVSLSVASQFFKSGSMNELLKSQKFLNFTSSLSMISTQEEELPPLIEEFEEPIEEEEEEEHLDLGTPIKPREVVQEVVDEDGIELVNNTPEPQTPRDPKAPLKYKALLGLIFGKEKHDNFSYLRGKILNEYQNRMRKPIEGVDAVNDKMSVNGVLDTFFKEKHPKVKKEKKVKEAKKRITEMESVAKMTSADGMGMPIQYNSRKFKVKQEDPNKVYVDVNGNFVNADGKLVNHNGDLIDDNGNVILKKSDSEDSIIEHDKNNEDDKDKEKSTENEDSARIPHKKTVINYDIVSEAINGEDVEFKDEEVSDDEIDAATFDDKRQQGAFLPTSSRKNSWYSGSEEGGLTGRFSHDGTPIKPIYNEDALQAVNKVVFYILEKDVQESHEPSISQLKLVEVDSSMSVERLNIDKIEEVDEEKKKKQSKKDKEDKPKRISKTAIGPRRPKKIVVPSRNERQKNLKSIIAPIIRETANLPTLQYFGGGSLYQNSIKPRPKMTNTPSEISPIFKLAPPTDGINTPSGFEYADQVVSFGGGDGRALKGATEGFNNVRIRSSQAARVRHSMNSTLRNQQTSLTQTRSSLNSLKRDRSLFDDIKQVCIALKAALGDSLFRDFAKSAKRLGKAIGRPKSESEIINEIINATYSYGGRKPESIHISAIDFAVTDGFMEITQQLTNSQRSPSDAASAVLKIVSAANRLIPDLQKAVDQILAEMDKLQTRPFKRPQVKRTPATKTSSIPPDSVRSRVPLADNRWMVRRPVNCVELQFAEDGGLDALLAPVEKKPRAKVSSRSRRSADRGSSVGWDDILSNFDLDELISVAHAVVPEDTLDGLLDTQ